MSYEQTKVQDFPEIPSLPLDDTTDTLNGMFGFLNIHKPVGPTSHDIVAQLRRMLPRKTKVGHAGTLDPFAEGVLVVGVGAATRLADYVQGQSKRYRATITLGATSDTDDRMGTVISLGDAPQPTANDVAHALPRFTGDILQIPPAHSAIHIDGERAYNLARAGQEVCIPARTVRVYELELLEYAYPRLMIDVHCGCGTYIRSIARDIGLALGCGGYCEELTRTAVGKFTLETAIRLEELDAAAELDLSARLICPETVLTLPKLTIDGGDEIRIRMGQRIALPPAETDNPQNEYMLLDAAGQLIALAYPEKEANQLRPRKVFPKK